MSNIEASKVYETVLETVINDVRQEFEDSGVDEQTLQDLKRIWQMKLSESKAATFIWDPENTTSTSTVAEPVVKLQNGEFNDNSINHSGDATSAGEADIIGSNINNGSSDMVNNDELQIEDNEMKPKQEIEFSMNDPDGDLTKQLKLQAKQAKKSALLETDEINSDLDDSDDDYVNMDVEDEGADVNMMLCLYDKVLRVKNKWKCNLKEGVVTIDHKDFAFQKAQGESEW
ncbi:Toa1 [Kluyveromyces lactis]|nr:Toa1 [Kluyveromyces lactis]